MSRLAAFFAACVPARLAVVVAFYLLQKLETSYRWALFGYGTFVAIGFSIQLYLQRPRGFLGGAVWWNKLRYVHTATHFLAALFAVTNVPFSWAWLLLDVVVAVASASALNLVTLQ